MIQIGDAIISLDVIERKFCCDLAACRGRCCVEGDEGTPLVKGGPCAYAIEEGGGCWCAIEKAWSRGECDFRKPISCHLYPIRVTKYRHHEAVNYNEWSVCRPAVERGEREGVPVYVFCRDALIAKYGEEWYEQLCYAAEQVRAGKLRLR